MIVKTLFLLSFSFTALALPKAADFGDCRNLDDVIGVVDRQNRLADEVPPPLPESPGSTLRRIRSSRVAGLVGRYLAEGYTIEAKTGDKMDYLGIELGEVESILESGTFHRDRGKRDSFTAWGRLDDGLRVGVGISLHDETMSVTGLHFRGSRSEVYSRIVGHIEGERYTVSNRAGEQMRDQAVNIRDILRILKNSSVYRRADRGHYIIWGRLPDGLEIGMVVFLKEEGIVVKSVMTQGDRQGILPEIRRRAAAGDIRNMLTNNAIAQMREKGVGFEDVLSVLGSGEVRRGTGEYTYVVLGKLADGLDIRVAVGLRERSMAIVDIQTNGSRWGVRFRVRDYISENRHVFTDIVGRAMEGRGVRERDALHILQSGRVEARPNRDTYSVWGTLPDGREAGFYITFSEESMRVTSIVFR